MPILGLAGSIIQAKGEKQAGLAQKAAFDYNASIQEGEAKSIQAQKEIDLHQLSKERRRRVGTIRARAGFGGGSLSGSPLHVLNDTVTEFSIEKQIVTYNADLGSFAKMQGAALSKFEGNQALIAAKYKSYATLLKGGAKFGSDVASAMG